MDAGAEVQGQIPDDDLGPLLALETHLRLVHEARAVPWSEIVAVHPHGP